MNTIVVIDTSRILGTQPHKNIGAPPKGDAYNLVGQRSTVAWYITPGSLHKSGEVYEFMNGNLYRGEPRVDQYALPVGVASSVEESFTVKGKDVAIEDYRGVLFSGEPSDLILPRGIMDDLNELAGEYGGVYLIRTPSIGLGKLRLEISRELAPMLVQKPASYGRTSGLKQKQKHVSKPNTPK